MLRKDDKEFYNRVKRNGRRIQDALNKRFKKGSKGLYVPVRVPVRKLNSRAVFEFLFRINLINQKHGKRF